MEHWVCTNTFCARFWQTSDGEGAEESLTYNPVWLQERSVWGSDEIPWDTNPSEGANNNLETKFQNVASIPTVNFNLGRVCPQCGGCVAKESWAEYCCDAEGCTWVEKLPTAIIPASVVVDQRTLFDGRAIGFNPPKCNEIGYERSTFGLWAVHKYSFGPDDWVYHLQSNKTINAAPGGPDEMFMQLQRDEQDMMRPKMTNAVGWYCLPFAALEIQSDHLQCQEL